MRTAYKVLAYIVAAEVAVQAMFMVWAIAGLVKWIDGGGVFDKSVIEGEGALPFPEIAGVFVHVINGSFVIPGLALLLLIFSFFTKVRGAIKWALVVFVLVIIQNLLGGWGLDIPLVGGLHGLNALVLFGVSIYAGRRLRAARTVGANQSEARAAATG